MAITTRRVPTDWPKSDLTLLVGGLAIASAVELAILRTFTRTAIHIPALNVLQKPYEVLTDAGQYAYYLSVALLAPALLLLGLRLGGRGALALFGLLLFTATAGAAAAGLGGRLAIDSATVVAVAVLAGAVAVRAPDLRAGVPFAAFGAAFALSGGYVLVPELSEVGISASQPDWLLNGAEIAGLAFAISTPFFLTNNGNDRFVRNAAIGVALLALIVFLGNGSTSRFLLLWNVGLSGTLPGVAYAVAAGALTLTALGLLRAGRGMEAAGLLLLITGGIGLHSTYQSGLVVAGLAAIWAGLATTPPEYAEARSGPD